MLKPCKPGYPISPQTLGEHIKKVRMDKGLFQKDVAELLDVSEDTITYWENGRSTPQVHFYPVIFQFLGYYPFDQETDSVAGKLQQILHCKGWNHNQCAKALGIDGGTVKRILQRQRTFGLKSKSIVLLWAQLPDFRKQ